MNELEALNLAIEREIGAYRAYSEAASRATDAQGKRTLSWLAREELGHRRVLEKVRESLKKGGKWLPEEDWVTSSDISEPIDGAEFPPVSEAKGELKADAGELALIKSAIEKEREAASFYAETARAASDPGGKAMLLKLSQVEQGHQELLEREYDWLRKSKAMFTIHRFSLPPQG